MSFTKLDQPRSSNMPKVQFEAQARHARLKVEVAARNILARAPASKAKKKTTAKKV